jgi:hypothetical protein
MLKIRFVQYPSLILLLKDIDGTIECVKRSAVHRDLSMSA